MSSTPKSYPVTDVIGHYDGRSGYVSNQKGKSRYTAVNPYNRRVTSLSSMKEPTFATAHGSWVGIPFDGNAHNLLRQRAYSRIVEDLKGDSASIGNAVGEWRSSTEMIARRALTIRTAWKRVRAGDPFGAVEALTIPPDTKYKIRRNLVRKDYVRPGRKRGRYYVNRQKFVSQEHYYSSLWLEMYFGFLPLMSDIESSIKVLSEPVRNPTRISGSARQIRGISFTGYYSVSGSAVDSCRYFAEVEISNPNLFLANRMGLVNPAAIAWELVPFSFVVDWFTNVGQIIESVSDFAGVSILSGGYTQRTKGSAGLIERSGDTIWNSFGITHSEMSRTPGVSAPPLTFRNPLGNWKRAATQVSLLVQLFIKPR